jgi:holo-[acyl-carrier protein] synthase
MTILGIGVDIIQNKRIEKLLKDKKFINRTFTKNEISFSKKISNNKNYFAKRFAAKESFAKAIGTGFRKNLNLRDIEVLNDKLGKPFFSKSVKIKKIINNNFKTKKYDLFLSISDEKDYSIAFTILQKRNVK